MRKVRIPLTLVVPMIACIAGAAVFIDSRLATETARVKPTVWTAESCTKCHGDYGHQGDPKYTKFVKGHHTALLTPGGSKLGGGLAPKNYVLPWK